MIKRVNKKYILYTFVTLLAFIVLYAVVLYGNIFYMENIAIQVMNLDKLPVSTMRPSYVVDVKDNKAVVGKADYVFAGHVVSVDKIEYRNSLFVDNFIGLPKFTGTPYMQYTVQVTENIKGELITDETIIVYKQGGIAFDRHAFLAFENDFYPKEDEDYIFIAFTQNDGSLLVAGENSSVPINAQKKVSAKTVEDETVFKTYQKAYENQIVPSHKKELVSIYDIRKN